MGEAAPVRFGLSKKGWFTIVHQGKWTKKHIFAPVLGWGGSALGVFTGSGNP